MSQRITIQDIAAIAGVSLATVSRALSRPELVAEATRQAVLEAVRRTGYQTNHTARNLRRKRSGSVLALVPNLANPFFSEILSGLASVLTATGHGLLIADTRTGPDPGARLNYYLNGGVADGVVILDGSLAAGLAMERGSPPIVLACEWSEAGLPAVRVDNEAAAAIAVGHLVDKGHRAIGHITGPPGNVLTTSRLAGMRARLAADYIELPRQWIFPGDFSLASGAAAARTWLELEQRPSAVFCASDEMACGFIGALQHTGIDVPGQISVVGFDDIEVSAHLTPALTTIRQPRRLIGERAARLLIDMIETPGLQTDGETISVQLIERQSVAPPWLPSP